MDSLVFSLKYLWFFSCVFTFDYHLYFYDLMLFHLCFVFFLLPSSSLPLPSPFTETLPTNCNLFRASTSDITSSELLYVGDAMRSNVIRCDLSSANLFHSFIALRHTRLVSNWRVWTDTQAMINCTPFNYCRFWFSTVIPVKFGAENYDLDVKTRFLHSATFQQDLNDLCYSEHVPERESDEGYKEF